jgi:hypothetical protein
VVVLGHGVRIESVGLDDVVRLLKALSSSASRVYVLALPRPQSATA